MHISIRKIAMVISSFSYEFNSNSKLWLFLRFKYSKLWDKYSFLQAVCQVVLSKQSVKYDHSIKYCLTRRA